jgi:DNA polymerase-3 subunit epsilon
MSARPPRQYTEAFVAIDFETADPWHDSACAVALVRVEGNRIVRRVSSLIRPPRKEFHFTGIHHITWRDVADAPTFEQVWPSFVREMSGVKFLAAHYAEFDRSVLETCCDSARLPRPRFGFRCTMELARSTWSIYPTKLPHVCDRLGIPLQHHDAVSDAEACARIVLAGARCADCPDARGCIPAHHRHCSQAWLD